MTDLNSLIPAGTGITLAQATGINDIGQIAAWGSTPAAPIRALLLTPNPVGVSAAASNTAAHASALSRGTMTDLNHQTPGFTGITVISAADFSDDELSGTVRINTVATPGTALLLRGFEFTQGIPVDLNDLKLHGVLKWEMLLQGPFDLRDNDEEHCNALVIPFTIKTSPANLYFVSDGAAISKANDPPVPSATTRPFASCVLATLSATDDSTASDKIKIWVLDAATPAFKAGPFKVGDKLFLRRNPNQPPFSHPLSTPYTAQVQTKGQTLLIAEDDEGGVTNPGVPVP
jgi:hypothetical protein